MMMTTFEENQANKASNEKNMRVTWYIVVLIVIWGLYSCFFLGIPKLSSGIKLAIEASRLDPTADFEELEEKCIITQVVHIASRQKTCSTTNSDYDCRCTDEYSYRFRAPHPISSAADGFVEKKLKPSNTSQGFSLLNELATLVTERNKCTHLSRKEITPHVGGLTFPGQTLNVLYTSVEMKNVYNSTL